eukprot:4365602-Amphidinium_carterae.1
MYRLSTRVVAALWMTTTRAHMCYRSMLRWPAKTSHVIQSSMLRMQKTGDDASDIAPYCSLAAESFEELLAEIDRPLETFEQELYEPTAKISGVGPFASKWL